MVPNDQHASSAAAPTWATWAMSVVNGLVGDYLRDRHNGLAIDMAFYYQNRPLPLTRENLFHVHPRLTPKLCILVHGLGCHESIWTFRDPLHCERETSYGALLQMDRGYTPFYLRYNTGLSVADNGKRLATLLDDLLCCYPLPIQDIVLIGHSMGGLILRSACHYGMQHHSLWVQHVTRVFYLGTPHDGADLERLANGATIVLQALPNPITKIIRNVLNLRSQGVKDLRFGTLLEPDVIHDARDELVQHQRRAIPWLADAQHYLISGTLTDDPRHPATQLFGDGLVGVPRAAEPGAPADARAHIPTEHVRLFPQTHHFRLACDWAVYQQINAWCEHV